MNKYYTTGDDMFIANKYSKWYYSIIKKAKLRTPPSEEYTENHHIVPRSLGGSNKKENIVRLSAREHFVCHLLLPKFTSGDFKKKMEHAAFMLTTRGRDQDRYKVTNRWYQILKERMSAAKRGIKKGPHTKEQCKNISKSKKGIPMKKEQKILLSKIKKNVPWSEARKKAGKHIITPYGIFYSISEAERQIGVGKGVVRYRMKTMPSEYYFSRQGSGASHDGGGHYEE